MGLTSYGHAVSLPDFNPTEDNIILSPSNVGRGLTGYEINGNELTLTYHNTSYPGNESKIILPDGLDLTAVQNAITIDDPLPDWMEDYPTITHKDEYEKNWQYDGSHISDANVIYDTRWDDHIKGSDIDQDIYLTHGNDIVDGAGGSDTVHIDELFSSVSISRDGENTIVTNGDDQITLSNIEYAQFNDDLVDLRATGWEITDSNDLRWFDVASGVDIILNQSDYPVGPPQFDGDGNLTGYASNESQSPDDVSIIQLSNGNLAAVWSVDVWKELADGSWSNTSVSDVFYRVFNPADGSFITDEIRLTDNEQSDVIQEVNLVRPDLSTISFQIDNFLLTYLKITYISFRLKDQSHSSWWRCRDIGGIHNTFFI